jgi:hypothetical protein
MTQKGFANLRVFEEKSPLPNAKVREYREY